MDAPKPPRRRLTAAQKRAGIKLVKGWKPPVNPEPASIYRCFASRARIDGKDVMIGVSESRKLHRDAIWRGMTGENGEPKASPSWQEKLIVGLRTVTSAPDFNHEWWAAKTVEPAWVKSAEKTYHKSWLYFPACVEDLAPRTLGTKIGYYLTLSESSLELAVKDAAYLEKVEQIELEKAQRGLDDVDKSKVRVVLPGYDSWKQLADESYKNMVDVRSKVVSLVADEAPRSEFGEFMEGFATGVKKAKAIDLANRLSEYNKTEEVIGILLEHWPAVDGLETRTEISRYVRNHLPDEKKKALEDEEGAPWINFCVWIRDIYDKIGLSPSEKGAPKKNREKEKE